MNGYHTTNRAWSAGSNRVNCGGSWNNLARNCRSANRNNNSPDNRNNNLGFRLASVRRIAEHVRRTGPSPVSVRCQSPSGANPPSADGVGSRSREDTARAFSASDALRDGHHAVISPDGHYYRGSPGVEKELVYVALTDSGEQLTLTPEEFSKKYGWKNDPSKAEGGK